MSGVLHELKTDPIPFSHVYEGLKLFEIRRDDRTPVYAIGDRLNLRETHWTGLEMKDQGKPLEYTGREIIVKVLHVMRGPVYGVQDGWIIMSILSLEQFGRGDHGLAPRLKP
jgi:hypothetical protein